MTILRVPGGRNGAHGERLGFRSILIPVNTAQGELPCDMFHLAARLATERRASIELLTFTEIPLWEEMDVELPGLDQQVLEMAKQARAVASRYGVGLRVAAPRTRNPAQTILAEARRRHADLIVLGATGRRRAPAGVFGDDTARRVAHEAEAHTMFVQAPVAA